MTAQQELQTWLEQHRQLDNETAREQFFRLAWSSPRRACVF